MGRAAGIVATGALALATIGFGAQAAHAAPVLTLERWDTSTCATRGAASPVVSMEWTNPGPYAWLRSFGIDDQDGYATLSLMPQTTFGEATLAPVRAGEHTVYEMNRTPGWPPVGEAAITAPACPAGSPEPDADVWPQVEPAGPVLTATLGDPTCEAAGWEGTPVIPFDYGNSGDEDGLVLVDIEQDGSLWGSGYEIAAGDTASGHVELQPGEQTVTVTGTGHEVLVPARTVKAPDCSEGSEPGEETGTDEPGGDTNAPGGDTGAPAGEGQGSAAAPTPEIPSVVQTG